MKQELHKELLQHTSKLRTLLATCSSYSTVGMCATYFLNHPERKDRKDRLVAPARQIFFLLGIMLTTAEPAEPRQFDQKDWEKSTDLLNRIFSTYSWMYWPTPDELPTLTEEWKNARMVAMPAFLHYFTASLMASVEQIRHRTERYGIPFDDQVLKQSGLRVTQALAITNWIAESLQRQIDDLVEDFRKENELRSSMLDRAESEGWSLERLRQEAQTEPYLSSAERALNGLQSMMTISFQSICENFGGQLSKVYWSKFVSHRGQITDFQYLTEANPAQASPLFALDDVTAMCPSVNMLFHAVLAWTETTLLAGELAPTYLKHRDNELEQEVADELNNHFQDSAQIHQHLCETETGDYEHDLILICDRQLAIIEAKASPPQEPFRDPDKAFVRIQRFFNSDRGIQKAFEQADRIRTQLSSGTDVSLYSKSGAGVISLKPTDFDFVLTVCISRDDFGPLAVDLSLLLQKAPDVPYPWAINILDLQNLLVAWRHLGYSSQKFFTYAKERISVNGKLLCFDELEIAGFDIHHTGLQYLINNKADRVHLNPTYSEVFDDIYRATQLGEKVHVDVTEPFAADVRELLKETSEPAISSTNEVLRVGRNDRCPCGSGLKFKRCHGK